MIVGPNLTIGPASITLNGGTIAWVDNFKYLGVIVLSRSKFSVDLADTRRRFFIASNYILSHCSFATDLVKLELMEKHCLPILLYCMEVLNLSTVQIKDINAWWNCVIRKIFGYNKWESVKQLIFFLGRVEIGNTVNIRHVLFLKNISKSENLCMKDLFNHFVTDCELIQACSLYKVKLHWTDAHIRCHIRNCFFDMCLDRLDDNFV